MKLIRLSQDKFAKVDDEDFDKINQYKWCFIESHGASWRRKGKGILMHRFIINAPKYLEVDHKNGDRLDNQKNNLRICTHADNMRNRKINKSTMSGYKGVRNNHGRWQACITFNHKFIHLGNFTDKKVAAQKYNETAKQYFGEFARLNEL